MANSTVIDGVARSDVPDGAVPRSGLAALAGWLRGTRLGLFVIAVLVGVGAGLGAMVFRYLVYGFTWLATGQIQFGQQGWVPSAHLPWLGLAFFVVIPIIGGLLYGPLIYRFAREARGHGVPEVMIAVAENGGRIRPQVSVVKALASALCISVGGSVGREGPIVQIGSALASSFGQWVRMPENRLRILVACGAAGGISATFNAPITGVFFGVELILREFSIEAIFTVMLSSMVADVISQAFLGSAPFFTDLPHNLTLHHTYNYLLVALLAVIAALIGQGFKSALYAIEDLCDKVWGNRPEWARPAVGGLVLGLLLLAIPQLYGVGYPVMYQATGNDYALWFLVLLAVGKMVATSLSIGIGGSGGVFAPSLFIGAMSGMAFGDIVVDIFGPAAGQPVLYAVVGMGAVFTAAARAPLTSLASVVEMTGDFTLALPVMLAVAISSAVSRAMSYGTIYTLKLLRRGTDIDRPNPGLALGGLTVADAMRAFPAPIDTGSSAENEGTAPADGWASTFGSITSTRRLPALSANESLVRALHQLVPDGRDGLPVLSTDGTRLDGWTTNQQVLRAMAQRVTAADRNVDEAEHDLDTGYRIVEYTLDAESTAVGKKISELDLPADHLPVTVLHDLLLTDAQPHTVLHPGDRLSILAPNTSTLG